MSQTLVTVAFFVLALAMVPMAIKWLQARSSGSGMALGAGSRVISAVAVGPNQRVVTVEIGPAEARTWLVLGVTPQSISCLHHMSAAPDASRALAPAAPALAAQS